MIVITDAAWNDPKLWGAKAIADFATVSIDTVYRWERLPDCPITKPGGRYFALKTALAQWMVTKDARSCKVLPDNSRSCVVDETGRGTA